MNPLQEKSYLSILFNLIKSTSFWSLVSGVTGVFAFLLGGGLYLTFDEMSDVLLLVTSFLTFTESSIMRPIQLTSVVNKLKSSSV